MFVDIHTHRQYIEDNVVAIVNADEQQLHCPLFSVGIHPWRTLSNYSFDIVERIAPLATAIGECGFDTIKGASMINQRFLFSQHIYLSQRLSKPLIIHCVRAYGELFNNIRQYCQSVPWLIHGCYASPEWIRSVLRYNVYFSLGPTQLSLPKAQQILETIPLNRLFLETDDSQFDIIQVYSQVAHLLNVSSESFQEQLYQNFQRFYH